MNIVGVIPSRWGSTRFPGKSLTPICGKPLVQWVYERSCLARTLSSVVVATDDDRIRRAVEGFGGNVAMTRSDHPSGTDRVAEVVRACGADLVVNIQGDEPLIDPVLIDQCVEVMLSDKALRWDMVTAAAPLAPEDAPSATICKVVCDEDGRALYFSRCPIPFVRDRSFATDQPLYWRHIGIYLYRRAFLERMVATPPCLLEQAECLEQLRAMYIGGRIKVVATWHVGIGVDQPQDVAVVESEIRRAGLM